MFGYAFVQRLQISAAEDESFQIVLELPKSSLVSIWFQLNSTALKLVNCSCSYGDHLTVLMVLDIDGGEDTGLEAKGETMDTENCPRGQGHVLGDNKTGS